MNKQRYLDFLQQLRGTVREEQVQKLRLHIESLEFQTRILKLQSQLRTGWDKAIKAMIADVLDVPVSLEDVQVIFNYVSATATAR